MTDIKIKRALISVSDKTGILEFAGVLESYGVEILSTGGTAKMLRESGIAVTNVENYTGFPEMLDGRIKTLHPKIHGGLLGIRENPAHKSAMEAHDIGEIDLLVVNLYPFAETVADKADFEECIENIDIGGPAMLRSAAKNHKYVVVVSNPLDYKLILSELKKNDGSVSGETRIKLARKVFAHTAEYDSAIANWLNEGAGVQFPETLLVTAHLKQSLRYGENPHQKAAFYVPQQACGLSSAVQLQGKELSYNNISDADAAFSLIGEFAEPAAAIIKHANPCGVALGSDLGEAFKAALECDPISAFGGIVALNRNVDGATATQMAEIFFEVIIAPSFSQDALNILSLKKNLRLLAAPDISDNSPTLEIKSSGGGILVQEKDTAMVTEADLKFVTTKEPTADQLKDLIFALKVVKHVKSNGIVTVLNGRVIGIGAGQTSRIKSVHLACEKVKAGAVLASDAFLPFADNVEVAAEFGISAIIQPGGSLRDNEVIEAADKHGIAMVISSLRHFKH